MNTTFSIYKTHLHVTYSGKRSFLEFSDLIDKIYEQCRKNQLQNILIDVSRATGDWDDFDRYKIGKKVSQLFESPYKIAAIEKLEKINKFAENTAVNRGTNLLVVSNSNEALKWLLK